MSSLEYSTASSFGCGALAYVGSCRSSAEYIGPSGCGGGATAYRDWPSRAA